MRADRRVARPWGRQAGAWLIGLAVATSLALAGVDRAEASRPLLTGFADRLFRSTDASERRHWLDRANSARAGVVKQFMPWRSIVRSRGRPTNPRDPADPAYNFRLYDNFVRDARARGLVVLIGFQNAPAWAEGANRPANALPGTWKPRPAAVGDFAHALARRYSGRFTPRGESRPLPRVRHIQVWNEANLPHFLTPQWSGRKPFGARHYKRMLNAAYRAVKQVHRNNRVVTSGLAPYGDDPNSGRQRTRPLRFWREVFCLNNRNRPRRRSCGARAHFDVLAHHAINTSGGPPRESAEHPEDATSGDLGKVRRVVRRAERHRTVRPRGRHPLWVTETWWETNRRRPAGVGLQRQARYIQQTMYLAWRAGFSVMLNLRIRDQETDPDLVKVRDDGIYFLNGRPKPSARAFRFPFVAQRVGKRRVRVWGKSPRRGRVVIQRKRGKRWQRVGRLRARGNRVFAGRVRVRGRAALRARVGRQASYAWRVRR